MRSFRVLILTCALAAGATSAQEMYPGQSVTVNPAAAGNARVYYPGGMPEPIHLHMPAPHKRVVHRKPRPAADASVADTAPLDTTPAPAETAPPADTTPPAPKHKKQKHVEVASTPEPTPAPDTSSSDTSTSAIPFSLSGGNPPPPPPEPKKSTKPVKVAKAEPPPAQTLAPASGPDAGFAKRGEIVFKHDATDPSPAQFDPLKNLAGDLNAALQNGASRIQLQAFGGAPGDKGSDARRLSLKRALSIRQVLIDNGVPSGKIDVRAMGGIDDHGNPDRVDVLIHAS
ncbi:MAG TPA: OmpA family protein [Rhizomicrobium sp.]|jgi:outer membrane protein OmpA-like peptidoglycan-associated protein